MRTIAWAAIFACLIAGCTAPADSPVASRAQSVPTTPDGRELTPYEGDYEPLSVVVDGEPGPAISTMPRRERAPAPLTVAFRNDGAEIQPAAGQAVRVRNDATPQHPVELPGRRIYVDAKGRHLNDVMDAGPDAYFDADGNYRLTYDRGDGAHTAYPGQDRPRAREAFDRAARALDDQ